MHQDHEIFLSALYALHKVQLTFFSKEDGTHLIRSCAPMDYGPSRRAKNSVPRYHFWDYDSDKKYHPLSIPPEQIIRIIGTEDIFSPAEFVTWNLTTSPWFITRDWAEFS